MKRRSTAVRKIRKLVRDPARFARDSALAKKLGAWVDIAPPRETSTVAQAAPPSSSVPSDSNAPLSIDPARVGLALGVPSTLHAHLRQCLPKRDLVFCANIVQLDIAGRVHGPAPVFAWRAVDHRELAAYARGRHLSVHMVSEGPLHSAGIPGDGAAPRSFAIAKTAITAWPEAGPPSPYDTACAELPDRLDAADAEQARAILELLRSSRVGKYSFVSEPRWEDKLPPRADGARRILVLGERERTPRREVSANALLVREVQRDHPHDRIVYKPHPIDVQRGTIDPGVASLDWVIDAQVALPDVLPHVDLVCVHSSLAGAEALFHGAPVTTYGSPFYAGRGLTQDRAVPLTPRRPLDLEQLVVATYVRAPTYIDPERPGNRSASDMIGALDRERSRACARGLLGLPRAIGRRKALALRVGPEWRGAITAMLSEFDLEYLEKNDEKRLRERVTQLHAAHRDLAIVLWGYFEPKSLRGITAELGLPIFRFEDGFLRSVGIGAEKNARGETNLPVSITLDSRSIYYNRHETSDIEQLLLRYPFDRDPTLISRARACIDRINELGLTKYNVTLRGDVSRILPPRTRKRVLVIGQVESDASIRYGCSRPIDNNALVRHAASENPDAEILYRPHPAVLRGAAGTGSDPRLVAGICRILHEEVNLPDLLSHIDHVYVITSGAGFEALLKGVRVTCFGANFYAGWGLTDDRDPVPRRTRSLTVEEVFAAFYLLHSRYYDHSNQHPIELEEAIELLERERAAERGVEHATRGAKALARGDGVTAKAELEEAVRVNPGMLPWWEDLSRAHELMQDWDATLRCCDHVLTWFPTSSTAYRRRALAAAHLRLSVEDIERDLDLAVRHAGPGDAVPQLARFAHRFAFGGEWSSLLDTAVAAAPLAVENAPEAVLVLCCAMIASDRVAEALRLFEQVRTAHPALGKVPLRVRAAHQRALRLDDPERWSLELFERLAGALDRALPPDTADRVTPVVDDVSLASSAADVRSRAIYIGDDRLSGALVHACPNPMRSTARHVIVSEHLVDSAVAGWHGLFEAISSGIHISVIPREVHHSLTRRLGHQPSPALLVVAWLRSQPRGLSAFDLSALRLASPPGDHDSEAEKREKALFAEITSVA